jgi:Tol biopolymer transport system component
MPLGEGPLTKVSPQAPSWWHGVSPDGTRLAYVAARGAKTAIDVYTLPVSGGAEIRLTLGEGHSDGPDYSPDGNRIYWNCDRPGTGGTRHAQIWVMDVDGSNQRQLFADDRVNWFPHPSPCGRWLLYLSYPPGTEGHPADLPVQLVFCDPEGGNRRILRQFIGGQGTINVPSWSPDGTRFAAMRYEV